MKNQRMLDELTELMRIDVSSGQETEIAEHLVKKLEQMGFAITRDEAGATFGGVCGNILAVREGERDGVVCFCSHMDRVPGGIGIKPVEEDGILRSSGDTILAALVGGLGMAPGSNIGADCAIFEATHGSAPDIAGQDIANPTAEILSAAMMLDHLGENDAANRIRAAVSATLDEGEQVTGDVRRAQTGSVEGAVGTQAFADAVIAHLA